VEEEVMKRRVAAGASVLVMMVGLGWKLARHPQPATTLRDVSLVQGSEHSQPRPVNVLAGIRIRLSPSDFGDDIRAPAPAVPRVSLARE
jgi:hypothetical protein